MATILDMGCPYDGLSLTTLTTDYKRNTDRDRTHHLHVQIDHLARCGDGHEFRVTGEILVESEELVRAQAASEAEAAPEVRTLWGRITSFFTGS